MKLQKQKIYNYPQIKPQNPKKDNVVKLNFGNDDCLFISIPEALERQNAELQRQAYQNRIDAISQRWEEHVAQYGEQTPYGKRIVD